MSLCSEVSGSWVTTFSTPRMPRWSRRWIIWAASYAGRLMQLDSLGVTWLTHEVSTALRRRVIAVTSM